MTLTRQDYPVGDEWKGFGQAVQVTRQPEYRIEWYNQESITVSSTAVVLSSKFASNADIVHITNETDQIRHWLSGSDPTASVGHLVGIGDVLELESRHEALHFRAIRVSTDATIRVSYGRRVKVVA